MITQQYNGIQYHTLGAGEPILFLHGLFLDKNSTQVFFEKDSQLSNFKRIYLDLPGMGNSEKIEDHSSNAIFKKLVAFIDHIIGEKSFIIYGHSYGAYLAQAISHHYQNQVSAMFLTCPVVIADDNSRITEKHKNEYSGEIKMTTNASFFPDFEAMNVLINKTSWLAYQELILPGLQKANQVFIEKLQKNNYELSFEQELDHFGSETKIQVVLGRYDHVVGYKQQLALFVQKENADITLLSSAGHNIMIDQPDVIYSLFNNLIKTP
ncbi:alpha/beta fold hydrolase [Leuconostoc carnosum]|uniref:alpha/beta fold hydrolase n=1 Tax=Leuconostoc carnosum TaxID=1252 RepID=UPI0012387461|nr:alpha/beta hydrolase [Leuconostoc carnosum]KAA8374104.1 alpha/beta hydrolase [Leuconostoc carnosum]KAA8376093.1 alpha/beta hydrolase [Leuconostoc carnosum]KAA8377855.1 alpha/beta hydrolase [Leuconostoc carnosum]MBB6432158.1 pimeloyl-ACP methyl ester carboxylesterase [Leuconostoc carnosum]